MLKLPKVTLVAVGSEKYREMHQKALDYSCRGIEFGAVKNIVADINDINDWNYFIIYRLHNYVDTSHCLLIHHDGFVINPDSWNENWLQYDYIGSPFPLPTDDVSYRDPEGNLVRVGNSVSLRSKRMLEIPDKKHWDWVPFHGWYNEDGALCCMWRKDLEELGMKYAPFEEAIFFGRERQLPENKGITPFVFHKWEGENAGYPHL